MAVDPRTLASWAEEVSKEAQVLTDYMTENGYYEPSFAQEGWKEYPELPPHIQMSKIKLLEASKAVYDLAAGPTEHLKWLPMYHNPATLRWLVHFKIPEAIPLHGSVPYAHVAKACDVDEGYLRRYLRFAMLNRLFCEPEPDNVAHTPYSALLVTDPMTRAWIDYCCLETFPAATKVVEAYERWGPSKDASQTAYSLANRTDLGFFEYLAQPGFEERASRFNHMMTAVHALPAFSLQYTVNGFDWASVRGKVVDVGGGAGRTAVTLAQAFPRLRIVVEDLDHVVAEGEANLPAELKDRVSFIGHDFFASQPESVMDAQVYLLRCVLHDHPDNKAASIVKHLLPALQRGSRLVVMDSMMPPPGVLPAAMEQPLRVTDLEMMQCNAGKERHMEDWQHLFALVDAKLNIVNINQQLGSALCVLTVALAQ